MTNPSRLFRSEVDDLPGERNRRSTKDSDAEERILRAARLLIARHGRAAVTLRDLASALRTSVAALHRHYCDLDSILAECITRHLQAVSAAMAKVPMDDPDAGAKRRAAYLAFTRTGFNAPTEGHILLLRDRHSLPLDLAEPIETFRLAIGHILAGFDATIALSLLDTMELDAQQIEAILSGLHPAQAEARPAAAKLTFKPPAPEPQPQPGDDLLALRRKPPFTKRPSLNQPRAGPERAAA